MTRRQLSASAALSLLAVALLIVWLWHYIAALIVTWGAWRYLARKHGWTRRRPKSSWSSLLRSGGIAFAAWNSRWLKPTTRASIPAKAGNEWDRPEGWDR